MASGIEVLKEPMLLPQQEKEEPQRIMTFLLNQLEKWLSIEAAKIFLCFILNFKQFHEETEVLIMMEEKMLIEKASKQ